MSLGSEKKHIGNDINIDDAVENKTYNSRYIGNNYEALAAEYLERNNYTILARNFRVRAGEIDIVAQKNGYIVFVEVKYRSNMHTGAPEESVDVRKRRQISKVALYFLNKYGYGIDIPMRFDVITVTKKEIRHIENAFDYIN